jgi:hypothetical protein
MVAIALTNMVNLYLGSDKDAELCTLAQDPKAQLDGYVYEALSKCIDLDSFIMSKHLSLPGLDPPFRGVYRMLLFHHHTFLHPTIYFQVLLKRTKPCLLSQSRRTHACSWILPMPT